MKLPGVLDLEHILVRIATTRWLVALLPAALAGVSPARRRPMAAAFAELA